MGLLLIFHGLIGVFKTPESFILDITVNGKQLSHTIPLRLVLVTVVNTSIGIAGVISMVSIVTIISFITNTLAVNCPPIWLEHFWVDLKQSAASVGASIYIIKTKTNKYGLSKDQSIW